MYGSLSLSIKKCFLIVIYVALFMTPVHLSAKNWLIEIIGDHSSGHRVVCVHNSICLNFYSVLQILVHICSQNFIFKCMNFECEYGFFNIVYEFWAWSICFSSSYGLKKFFWIFMNLFLWFLCFYVFMNR